MASVLEAPTIRIYDRSRKVAEERASRKFLKTPDRYAYKRHPLAISKAVTIDMEYDADAAAFVTYVNELHRMSSFGETESAALDNTAEMIRGYIGSMEANRKTIPLANSKTARTETAGRARLMSSDPAVSGKDAVRALSKLGFRLDRVEGSHHMMVKMGIRTPFPSLSTVPCHYPEALREASFAWRVLVRSGFLQR